jgi:virginiamycin B lyase
MSHDRPDDELEQLLRAYYAKKRAPAPDLQQVIAALDAALGAESGRLNHRYTATPPLSHDTLPRHFNREDADQGEDYAFTLEDTLEETMATDHDPHTSHPATTARSSRWNAPQRMLSPRVTAIAGIAAALIIVIIAATVYTQFAAHHIATPVATATRSALSKVVLPNANTTNIFAGTTTSDGSFWYGKSTSHAAAIGHVTPDGITAEFPIPTEDTVTQLDVYGMAVGSDGALWFNGFEVRGTSNTSYLRRMTPSGVFTSIPPPTGVSIGKMIDGPEGALWFAGNRLTSQGGTDQSVIGKITMDGHITTFPTLSQEKDGGVGYLCVGPDQAIWYAWSSSFNNPTKVTGRIGRVSLTGQVHEFAVPYATGALVSGSDGALWFSEWLANATGDGLEPRKGYIGHITTAGVISEVPIDPSVSIDELVTGPDGAVWYPVFQDDTGRFGRVAPSGDAKTFTTGGNAAIVLITAAPGALWLLDARNTLWHYRLT